MSVLKSDLAAVLKNNHILFIPSCVIVSMLAEFYSRVSTIGPAALAKGAAKNLAILLRRLAANLQSAADAYGSSRARFFSGDWREDRLRARALYFNLVARLGYLGGFLEAAERDLMRRIVGDMHRSWAALEDAMKKDCGACGTGGSEKCSCRYFRSTHPACWRSIMARTVMAMHNETAGDRPDTILILLCYTRVKAHILRELSKLECQKTVPGERFSPGRILCLSEDDRGITCPKCLMLTEELRHEDPMGETRNSPLHRVRDAARAKRCAGTASRTRPPSTAISPARCKNICANSQSQGLDCLSRQCQPW